MPPKAGSNGGSKATSKVPVHSLHLTLLAVVLSLAVFRFFIQDSGDRYQCNALLTKGRWFEEPHKSWQPEGCMLHPYKPREIQQCFQNRHVVYMGDSIVRSAYYAMVAAADPKIEQAIEKHSDIAHTISGTRYSFFWDPFLNSTAYSALLERSLASRPGLGGPGMSAPPAMAVIGTGLWDLRWSTQKSGIPTRWKLTIENLFDSVEKTNFKTPIADEIFLLPVQNVIESKLDGDRAKTIHSNDIQLMNEFLDLQTKNLAQESFKFRANFAVPTIFNEMTFNLESETEDGLHFSPAINKIKTNVLLNSRCNDVLPKKFPFDKTCCNRYPTPNWVQFSLLLVLLAWAPAGFYLHSRADSSSNLFRFFPEQKFLMPAAIFGFAVSLLFVADRTSLFQKENKQYDALTFTVLCLAALAAGLLTMKPAEKDLGFLNRDQTDEWKGWMQIAILIYHYVGASKISGIYNPIRVLVAAYLFMSGYGHLSFFLKKADFGFARVANILVRLNLLTVVLSYLMNTDYLSYYFSPLVTIWFGIIWVTMWAGNQYNDRTGFLLTKLIFAAGLVAVYFEMTGPLEATFSVINSIFATEWNATEWRFRVTLDMYIVWIGMLTAYAFIKIKELRITDRPEWPQWEKLTIFASGISMLGYFVFELTRETKFVYNAYHPYVSCIPVLAFCVLRNATPYLRSTSSKFFIFFGQCSLETFIIQFHLFIAGDTKGIIMMIPGGPILRPINFIVTSLVFVYVSNQVSIATGSLTEFICSKGTAAARIPTSVPRSASTTTSNPTPGTGEYVALSTVNVDDASAHLTSEKGGSGAVSGDLPQLIVQKTLVNRVGEFVKRDLRVKFGCIILGLWFLNWIYPSA